MSDSNDVHTSKFLSLVLRHRPELVGLELDPEGWLTIDALIAGARAAGRSLTREEIAVVVERNDKQRFAISADGERIRANQGHTVGGVDLALDAVEPPPSSTTARWRASSRASPGRDS